MFRDFVTGYFLSVIVLGYVCVSLNVYISMIVCVLMDGSQLMGMYGYIINTLRIYSCNGQHLHKRTNNQISFTQ